MTREILSDELKRYLVADGERNGSQISEENLEDLEKYLDLNPKGSEMEYLKN